MVDRFFGWRLVTPILGFVVLLQPDNRVSGQELDERDSLRFVADATNDQSRMIAVGISSLANLKIETFDVDAAWAGSQDSPLDLIRKDENGFGLIDISKTDLAEVEAMTGLHAVMKFWLTDEFQEQSPATPHPGHLLVANAAVSPEFIHLLLDMVQNEGFILKAANVDLSKIGPLFSLSDLPLSHHQGVVDYLEANNIELAAASSPDREASDPTAAHSTSERGIAADLPSGEERAREIDGSFAPIAEKLDQTAIPGEAETGRSFTLLFETDNAELDPNDIKSVAEACRYAATLSRARFIISGHTDTVGPASYNNRLAGGRAESVANAIRNDPRFREALSVMEYGESKLAVATGDNVPEAMNRRVQLTIVEDR